MKNSQQYITAFLTLLLALFVNIGAVFAQTDHEMVNPSQPLNIPHYPSADQRAGSKAQAISYIRGEDYAAFLTAVARYDDPYALSNNGSIINQHIESHVTPNGKQYIYVGPGPDLNYFNINQVGWYSMARYCNWVQNGSPMSIPREGSQTTEEGAYTLDGLVDGPHPALNSGSHYYVGPGEMIPL